MQSNQVDQLSDEVQTMLRETPNALNQLTHSSLCEIRKIAMTTMPVWQDNFNLPMLGISWEAYSELQASNLPQPQTVPIPLHVLANLGDGNDALTGAVLSDCLECFDLICSHHPTMVFDTANQFGWSLVALAAFSGSSRILERLLNPSHLRNDTVYLLTSPGNSHMTSPCPLEMLVRNRDLRNLELIFRLTEFRLHEFRRFDIHHNPLSGLELELCTFVTPFVAGQLNTIGLPIYNCRNELGETSWHAAVHNGPVFLEWMRQHSSLPMSARDEQNRTPWDRALKWNCTDCVNWLAANGAVQNGMASYLIAEHTAIYNDRTLQAFISSHELPCFTFVDCVMMIRGLLEGLKLIVQIVAPQENTTSVREIYETDAIENCKLIWNASTEDSLTHIYVTRRTPLGGAAHDEFARTIAMARDCGFLRFAQFISNPQLNYN